MPFTTLIDVPSLEELLGDERCVVLDCRFDLKNPQAGRLAYVSGHIPTARHADLNQDLSAPVRADSGRHPLPDPAVFAATLASLGIGAQSQVIAYDEANGSFAARAWWMLRWMGHTAAAVLDGGLAAWTRAQGALEAGEEPARVQSFSPDAPPRFFPRLNPDAVIGTDQVAGWLADPNKLLVDARLPERFSGETEPIDAAAGHIPGAVNHPFSRNLGPDGRFLPAAELRRRWSERLAGRAPQNIAAMCGSGVTACHDLLSLEVAGLSGAKLYAGSWSEWIRDPKRPTAKGP